MTRPARITTNFPSVLETAKRLGVSEHDAMRLSEMAERSVKTGEFAISGLDQRKRTTTRTTKVAAARFGEK